MYINPTYRSPKKDVYMSQHPYLCEHVSSHTCDADMSKESEVMACVEMALATDLEPLVPKEFLKEAYMERAWKIFGGAIERGRQKQKQQ